MWSRAIGMAVVLLGILFSSLQGCPQKVVSLEEYTQEVSYPSYVNTITYTVYNMHWESLVILQKTAYVTATLGGWSVPDGAKILSNELRVYPGKDPQWRGWFTYEGQLQITTERVIFASGIGRNPEPYYKEYILAPGEYVYASYIRGTIYVQDKHGSVMPVLVPNPLWGEYTDYHVGDVVEYVVNPPIYIPNEFLQTAMAN